MYHLILTPKKRHTILGFETSFTTNNSDLSSLALPYLALGTFVPTLKLIFGG